MLSGIFLLYIYLFCLFFFFCGACFYVLFIGPGGFLLGCRFWGQAIEVLGYYYMIFTRLSILLWQIQTIKRRSIRMKTTRCEYSPENKLSAKGGESHYPSARVVLLNCCFGGVIWRGKKKKRCLSAKTPPTHSGAFPSNLPPTPRPKSPWENPRTQSPTPSLPPSPRSLQKASLSSALTAQNGFRSPALHSKPAVGR